jgi:hypothetical protein
MTSQDPPTTQQWRHQFPSTRRSVPRVRERVRAALEGYGYGPEDIDIVELVCSEPATNAVRHGHRPGRLVEVSDASSRAPRPRAAGAEDENGRGLALVAALAKETGHHARDPLGKTV